jgi:hypothetical protein
MSGYRGEIEASAGPDREGLIGGGAQLLVRVRLFDGPGVVDHITGEPAGEPDAFTNLRPRDARDLAFELLAAAEHADQQTLKANHWEPQR